MKKLNRKGFTLVELLAVIIILAIVVGITIPAVLTMVDSARQKAGEDAAAVVADWVDKQYNLRLIGLGGTDDIFNAVCFPSGENVTTCDNGTVTVTAGENEEVNNDAFIKAAGLTPSDIETIEISIDNDRACVVVNASSGGNFYINRSSASNVYRSLNCQAPTTSNP